MYWNTTKILDIRLGWIDMEWLLFSGDEGINGIFDPEANKSKKHKRDDLLVPFKTKTDKNRYEDFSGVVGAFSRLMSGTKIKNSSTSVDFYEHLKEKMGGCSEEELKKLYSLINDMYFEDNRLLPINTKALNYLESNISQQQVAEYLFSLFIDSTDLKNSYQIMASRDEINVLEKLVFDSLNFDGEEGSVPYQKADCLLPYVKEVFVEDYTVLLQSGDAYKEYINRFLAYYYMYYVTQLAVKLNRFEKGERNKIEKVFMTLNWEVVSRVRSGYEYGWKYVNEKLGHMFSHSVVLELLAHNNSKLHLDYIGYYKQFYGKEEDIEVSEEIGRVIELYKKWIPLDYSKCIHDDDKDTKCKTTNEMRRLFEVVDYQFINGGRKSHYNGYNRKFIDFVHHNFGKRRGTLGYTMGVNESDIIMFTNIILRKHEGKVSLSKLFQKFERRGLIFDRESKKSVTDLFDKMNLLEKRSDSGDAQYVKTIL